MKEQTYIIKNYKSFEPKHIFECGQCFRWNLNKDGSYTGVFGKNVLNVKKEGKNIIFKGFCEKDIKLTCIEYFNLEFNYEDIKKRLSKVDINLQKSIEYGFGIRILKQDLWETIISFIISANNNIPRIKGIIERISKKYGNEIKWNNNIYYTFPTPEQLSKASIEDLRALGLGFRDKRVYEMTKLVTSKQVSLEQLKQEKNLTNIREKLLTFPGIGPKVADCILLFSLNKYEVFPIDVWVRRVMNDLYIKNEEEAKVSKIQIEKIAKEKYKDLAGLAQQYLFYWKREA